MQVEYFKDFYIKPYVRMGPYLVGMATGYLLYKTQCKVKISKVSMLLPLVPYDVILNKKYKHTYIRTYVFYLITHFILIFFNN